MTNEIMKVEDSTEVVMRDIESIQALCQQLMKTKHYAAMGEAGIFAVVQKAKSLGINPLEALNGGLYYVQGRVGMSSEMMASLIRLRGHSITKDEKSDNGLCVLHGRRSDTGDTWTVSFSMEDARRAGLARGMYDKYPGVMLYNRAMSMLARQLFPDIIKGAGYTRDELVEITRSAPAVEATRDEVYEPEVKVITEEQGDELVELLSECEEEYREQVMSFLKRAPLSVTSLYDLPVGLYDRVRGAALKKAESRKNERMQQEIDQCEEVEV